MGSTQTSMMVGAAFGAATVEAGQGAYSDDKRKNAQREAVREAKGESRDFPARMDIRKAVEQGQEIGRRVRDRRMQGGTILANPLGGSGSASTSGKTFLGG